MEIKDLKKINKILLIDKPKGITSFDVIRILRRKYKIRKMGHSGTLDPLATGLMIIGVEEGTKALKDLIGLNKEYQASVLLGQQTSTGDKEGEIIKSKEINTINIKEIEEVLKEITGKILLPVPVYSAIKVKGQPLYKIARKKGYKSITPPKKEMEIFWIKIKNHHKDGDYYILNLEMKVKSGTYVRSIAEEIGKRLKIPATIKELRRTTIGEFKIENAIKIQGFR